MNKPITVEEKWVSPDQLEPYEDNPNQHTEEGIEKIAQSIEEYGWADPIIVDDKGQIIAGHGRLLAAKKRGFERVLVKEFSHLTERQVKQLRLAHNRVAEESDIDDRQLSQELEKILDMGGDADKTGYDEDEVLDLMEMGLDEDEDDEDDGSPIEAYEVELATEEQRTAWYAFMQALEKQYGPQQNFAERIAILMEQNILEKGFATKREEFNE